MFSYASDKPASYARFAIDLYQKGQANLGRLLVKPGRDVRNFTPPSTLDHIDWLTCASLRDSENWFLDFDDTGTISDLAGVTLPSEMEQWFRKAGYQDVREDTNVSRFHKDIDTVNDANDLFDKGYRVCLFISANMTDADDQSDSGSVFTMHWVVLREKIQVMGGNVKTKIFTWGKGNYEIPHPKNGAMKPLPVADFLQNFYGYVAAKG
jgi:hypothetical protein